MLKPCIINMPHVAPHDGEGSRNARRGIAADAATDGSAIDPAGPGAAIVAVLAEMIIPKPQSSGSSPSAALPSLVCQPSNSRIAPAAWGGPRGTRRRRYTVGQWNATQGLAPTDQ